jgi:thiol-disulfide isomerase/thioredoxin
MSSSKTNIQKILNWIIISLLVILFVFVGYYFYTNNDEEIGTRIDFGKRELLFPPLNTEFTFQTVDNRDFKLKTSSKKMVISGLEDKIVFFKIFGWDCQYCKKEIPELINLKNDLANSFEIIAMEAQKHSREESLKYIKEYGINYSVIDGNEEKRFYDYLKVHYGWNGVIPLTIVLGRGGKVLAYEVGVKSYNLSELMKISIARDKKAI